MPKVTGHPTFEGYGASEDGRVWSRRSGAWKELSPRTTPKGYLSVTINKKQVLVHRFVLECFVGPCPLSMETRHLDGNKTNNAKANLKWGTRSQNAQDRVVHGTQARRNAAKLTMEQVEAIRADDRAQRDIADDYGVTPSAVSKIKNKRRWAHS